MPHRPTALSTLLLVVLAASLAGAQTPPAPKPDNSDEAVIYERFVNRARFENDGTGIEQTEAVIRIQSRAGVEEFGQLVFGYSAATEQLKVDYVRVRKPNGELIATPDSTAQDFAPDVLREAPMYSDYRQRHISVTALQPGDTLEYHTTKRIVTPLAAGHFWYEHSFPKNVFLNEDRLEIDVPKSREVKLKTPTRKPDIAENGDRRIYTWVVKDIRPERDRDRDEDRDDDEIGPDVQLSTFTDWKQVAQWYARLQGERVVVDDGLRKKAEEITKGATTPEEKARKLYDYVAQNIRYVSLSFGVGRFQPHAANDVLLNGYGDCKDKHTLLAAMLKAEGIQSFPVLIHHERKLDVDVPSPAQFDHVITAARVGKGLTWLDATTEIAPYGLILYQLRNKEAVLASEGPEGGLQKTPVESPVKNFARFLLEGKFSEFGALDATLEFTAQGDRDYPMRAGFRQVPQSKWKDFARIISASWGLPGEVDDLHIDSIEDTSKPFHLKYHLKQDHYFQVPSSSSNFRPIPPLGVPSVTASAKSKEPFSIGPPGEVDYRVRLQFPSNFTVRTPTAVKMSRDYGEYSSSYTQSKGSLEGERKLIVKMNELPAARRADYDSFRNVTRSDEGQVLTASILAPANPTTEVAASSITGTAAELHKAGVKALQSKDYRSATDLLKRAVDQDDKLKEGWYDLGLAYAGANNHADAIRAFRKQLELDPNHKSANGQLAGELQQSGQSEEAIAAYKKQLEIVPFERSTHKNLGMLLAQLGRDPDARTELETAASIPPDDPETKMSLAQVYSRLGENAKAQALMKTLTGSNAADSGQDMFAAALTPDADPTQSENEARQVLYDVGEQFDSGEYDRLGPSAFASMRLVALAWARIGWSKFLRGENLEAMQFLNSAWLLSQSGTVANRLGQALEKQGQREKARQMYALAAAAGGSVVADSRDRLSKLADAGSTQKDLAQANSDLVRGRTVQLTSVKNAAGSAKFNLVFDASPRPERAEFVEGDESLRPTSAQLREKDFPVKFPDVSSVKIIRQGQMSCTSSGCTIELLPIEKSPPPASAANK